MRPFCTLVPANVVDAELVVLQVHVTDVDLVRRPHELVRFELIDGAPPFDEVGGGIDVGPGVGAGLDVFHEEEVHGDRVQILDVNRGVEREHRAVFVERVTESGHPTRAGHDGGAPPLPEVEM